MENESVKQRIIRKIMFSIENLVRNAYNSGYEQAKEENREKAGEASAYTEGVAYGMGEGRKEAWNLAGSILNMGLASFLHAFKGKAETMPDLFKAVDYETARDLYNRFVEDRQAISVGDEVIAQGDRFVVTWISADGDCIGGIDANGEPKSYEKSFCVRTGTKFRVWLPVEEHLADKVDKLAYDGLAYVHDGIAYAVKETLG